MRRKKLEYNFRQNFEWLESPENHGLILPFHRLFCPNLSKSAPCKCCAAATLDSTCTDCFNHMPANLKLSDSTQGRWINNNTTCCQQVGHCWNSACTGPSCFNDPNFTTNGITHCSSGTTGSITTCMAYVLSCVGGTPNKMGCLIIPIQCGSGQMVPPDQGGATSNSTTVDKINAPWDCTSPNFSFNVHATSAVPPYSSGATITVVPQ